MINKSSEPILVLTISRARSVFGIVVTSVLGLLLIWIALKWPPTELHWRFVLWGFGGVFLFAAWSLLRSMPDALVLTEDTLASRSGHVLCDIGEVRAVERGFAAFKPSGGFLLRLQRNAPTHWTPGLWWRAGKTIGVGGVTNAGEARAMADLISAMLAKRPRD